MEHHRSEWLCYLLGAALTLLYKWARYVWVGKTQGKSMKVATAEWFFDPSVSNTASWITTIGVVWVLGSAYIDGVVWLFGDYFKSIPVEKSIAFLLGSLIEMLAPASVKWIVSKLPIPGAEGTI